MKDHHDPPPGMASEIVDHYTRAEERTRLAEGPGAIERARTAEMMRRHLPPPPGRVLDVGTTAYFHRPEELREEVAAAGFAITALVGLEGPLWLLPGAPEDDTPLAAAKRKRCLDLTARVESEPSLLGMSAHLLAAGRKPA